MNMEVALEPSKVIGKESRFQKIKNKLKDGLAFLEAQKAKMNLDDALLGDNVFFKFLNDLLKSFGTKQRLVDELKENERLSKEKLLTLLNNELIENQSLSKEAKETIKENLKNEYMQNLTFKLFDKKIQENNTEIKAKDIVSVGNTREKSTLTAKATETIDSKKLIHKMTK